MPKEPFAASKAANKKINKSMSAGRQKHLMSVPLKKQAEISKKLGTFKYYLNATKSHSQATRLHKLGKKYGHSKVAKAMGGKTAISSIAEIEEKVRKWEIKEKRKGNL